MGANSKRFRKRASDETRDNAEDEEEIRYENGTFVFMISNFRSLLVDTWMPWLQSFADVPQSSVQHLCLAYFY